jgi:hypothetical protein
MQEKRFEMDNSILFINGLIQNMYIEDPTDVVDPSLSRMRQFQLRNRPSLNVQNIKIQDGYQGKKLLRVIWRLLVALARSKNLYLVISQVQNHVLRDALLRYKAVELDKNVHELLRSYYTKGMRKRNSKNRIVKTK